MATATSAWSKPGAWALESEEQAAMENSTASAAFPSLATAAVASTDFPSLAAAAASKPSKKKKPQSQSLAEFYGGNSVSHGAAARSRPAADASLHSKGLTPEELLLLPTGPRERSAEELERSSSRGFVYSSYGNGGPRRTDGPATRTSGDELSRNSLNRDNSGPSRADEVDDWGATKRSVAISERRDRAGGFFDSQSRADEVDSWISKKTAIFPPSDGGRRMNGGGSDGLREKRGGFEMFSKERSAVGGVDADSWGRKRDEAGRGDTDTWGRKKEEDSRAESDTWGRKKEEDSRAESDTWGRKKEEVTGSGGSRPRLVLQPRSLPLASGNTDNNGELNQGEVHISNIRSKGSNPFGEARPREQVLAEKGQDWKKLDEKLESMRLREGMPEELSFGKKGPGPRNGSLSGDHTEKSWRKEEKFDSPASMKEDKTEESLPDN